MSIRIILLTIIVAILCQTSGFGQIPVNKPECAVWDSLHNRYLVSLNVQGRIMAVDTSGIVTLFKDCGQGINSACISGNTFYQANMTSVSGYDLETADLVFDVNIPGSLYLGPITADTSGNLYVNDVRTFSGAGEVDYVFKIRLSDEAISEFTTTERGLGYSPRDIVFDAKDNRLLIIGATAPVYIQAISLEDSSVTNIVKFETDYSNGLAWDQFGNLYATGYLNGTIYRYDSLITSPPEIIATGYDGPCNIDYNPRDHVIAIPNYFGDRLDFFQVGLPRPTWQAFSDLTGGDGDGIPEAGETIDLELALYNTHFLPLTDLSLRLLSVSGGLTILDSTASIAAIASLSEASNESDPLRFAIPTGYGNQMDTFLVEWAYTSDYGTKVDTMAFVKPIGGASVLLVDDSHLSGVDDYYRDALTLIDSTYDIWDAAFMPPPQSLMSTFDVVIWFTGDQRKQLLNDNEIAVMSEYLDGGGNLILSGQDLAGQLDTVDQAFLNDYLRAEFSHSQPYPYMVADSSSSVFELSDQIRLGGVGAANNQTVANRISPLNGGEAALWYYNYDDCSAISYSGNYRLVFLAFGFEAITDGDPQWTDRSIIFDRLMNYFDWVNPFYCCVVPGDIDYNGEGPNIADLIYMVTFMFQDGPDPACTQNIDIDGDGEGPNIADLIYMVTFMFQDGPPIECPSSGR